MNRINCINKRNKLCQIFEYTRPIRFKKGKKNLSYKRPIINICNENNYELNIKTIPIKNLC